MDKKFPMMQEKLRAGHERGHSSGVADSWKAIWVGALGCNLLGSPEIFSTHRGVALTGWYPPRVECKTLTRDANAVND
jgi:hypothetical protein